MTKTLSKHDTAVQGNLLALIAVKNNQKQQNPLPLQTNIIQIPDKKNRMI
jgi:hypothetical protein